VRGWKHETLATNAECFCYEYWRRVTLRLPVNSGDSSYSFCMSASLMYSVIVWCIFSCVTGGTLVGIFCVVKASLFNPLTPNDHYSGRTAPLTSKRCILYIYSTNIGTEYFKHGIYSSFFFLASKCSLFHNSDVFGSCIIHILYTGCAKI
jgi:hypothetical protein